MGAILTKCKGISDYGNKIGNSLTKYELTSLFLLMPSQMSNLNEFLRTIISKPSSTEDHQQQQRWI